MTVQIQNFSDVAPATQLTTNVATAPVAGTVETWNVASSLGYPQPPFEFGIDLVAAPELCLCLSFISTTQWQVQRGYDNTTPVIHNISANQITLSTSAVLFQEGNNHISQTVTDHSQYMQTNGAGHDSIAKHTVGEGPLFSINTNNIRAIPPSHWDDLAWAGVSANPANSMHLHGRESYAELVQGTWPPGTTVLWGVPGPPPPGWMDCAGLDVRTDLAPQLFDQIGYTAGSAIDWYPPAPVFPTFVGYNKQTLIDQAAHTTVTAEVPYTYMWDPRQAVMYLPSDSNTYFKTPNIGQLPGIPPTVRWIIKVDYGYTWTPRPAPPAASPLYVTPYAVDTSYPQAVAVNSSTTKIVSSTKYKVGTYRTGFTWGYDAVMGIPVIMGAGYIAPGNRIVGPFLVPVYPYGSPLPGGTMLFPDGLLAEDVIQAVLHPPTVEVIKIVPIPPPKPTPPPPPPKKPPPKPSNNPPTYTVVKGDNLFDIAQRFHIEPWTDIEVWNTWILGVTGSYNLIYPGMVIYLGSPSGSGAATAPKPSTYVVRQGDNLYNIGLRFGLSLNQIEALNPQIPAETGSYNLIFAGMVVNV